MEENKSRKVETTTLEKVKPEEKKSWTSLAFIWAGNVICVPALMVGGNVVSSLNFKDAVISMLLGYIIVVVCMIFMASQSSQLGLPSTVGISRAFGKKGSGIAISLIIAISMTGWFGYQTYVCGSSFSTILQSSFNINLPIWISCIIWGSAMLVTAIYGIGIIRILNMVSVPALILFLVYGVAVILSKQGNIAAINSYVPSEPTSFITGITLSVGGFAAGAITSGDYMRYSKSPRETALSCIIGVIPAGMAALVCGAILSICSGSYDITVMFSRIGMPIIGMLVLILATWTTNTGNAYSSGIAVVNIFKLKDDKRMLTTVICGVIGILISLGGLVNVFVPFLTFLGYFIPPIAGVAIADYWILGRGNTSEWKPMDGVNWVGIISWILGAIVAYAFPTILIPTINAIIFSGLSYIIIMKIIRTEKVNPYGEISDKA